VLNALDAAERGAQIFTRTLCASAQRKDNRWLATLRDAAGRTIAVNARCLVNATGPWAAQFRQSLSPADSQKALRLIKGSHIVVRRLFDHPYAYIFQHPDGRIVFAIPYEQAFTLIGTTDIEYHGNADQIAIDRDEIDYLCALTNRYFRKSIAANDVVWSYSGVRPLVEDESSEASSVTRDYRLELNGKDAPLLSVFGGKITTFRKLAEDAVGMLAPILSNRHRAWTAGACLPGGDLFGSRPSNRAVREFDLYVRDLQQRYGWLAPELVQRYARAYGTRIDILLTGRTCIRHMGEEIAPGLHAAEVEYLMRHEWANHASDILWRRSKLGLHLPPDTEQKLDFWIRARRKAMPDEASLPRAATRASSAAK
jgi:glycerol-3-phosphate dehydrogenase